MRKIPIVATPISFLATFFALPAVFARGEIQQKLHRKLETLFQMPYAFTFNSGASCFAVILKALRSTSDKTEVVIPAYTAAPLVTAIQKNGLQPVLCDVSMDDFNMDIELLKDKVTDNTLCICVVHMFGIISDTVTQIKKKFPDVCVVEDFCQAFGSWRDSRMAGQLADISFTSFNRGKNVPTYGGGCLLTGDQDIAAGITRELKTLNPVGVVKSFGLWLKMLALSLVIRPAIYGLVSPLVRRLKDQPPADHIVIGRYSDVQSQVAISILERIEEFSQVRAHNGRLLLESLQYCEALELPKVDSAQEPAFNRFPFIVKDPEVRQKIEATLAKAGFESSRMYRVPLYKQFDLGVGEKDLPRSGYLARYLLTVPINPLLQNKDLENMIHLIEKQAQTQ